jgi:hypothetical protein
MEMQHIPQMLLQKTKEIVSENILEIPKPYTHYFLIKLQIYNHDIKILIF